LVQVQVAPLFLPILHQQVRCNFVDRSKSEKTDDAHTMHTDSLKSTARSSQPKGTDMRGIQKIKNKDGTHSYRAQIRLNDGLPPQSKSWPTLPEARAWKAQEETKRRQGLYFPSMTSKQNKLEALIDRYIATVLPSKPKNARNTQQPSGEPPSIHDVAMGKRL
jgi:hypothetical protein